MALLLSYSPRFTLFVRLFRLY